MMDSCCCCMSAIEVSRDVCVSYQASKYCKRGQDDHDWLVLGRVLVKYLAYHRLPTRYLGVHRRCADAVKAPTMMCMCVD